MKKISRLGLMLIVVSLFVVIVLLMFSLSQTQQSFEMMEATDPIYKWPASTGTAFYLRGLTEVAPMWTFQPPSLSR